jgi:hypothetical protein
MLACVARASLFPKNCDFWRQRQMGSVWAAPAAAPEPSRAQVVMRDTSLRTSRQPRPLQLSFLVDFLLDGKPKQDNVPLTMPESQWHELQLALEMEMEWKPTGIHGCYVELSNDEILIRGLGLVHLERSLYAQVFAAAILEHLQAWESKSII